MTNQHKAGMPIKEGNRLIAEFMEHTGQSGEVKFYVGPDGFEHESGNYLKYHSSWGWLIPVVEKIVLLHEPFTLRIGNVRSWANFDGQEKQCEESTIITVWLSVVEAIKKYNTQTSNQ